MFGFTASVGNNIVLNQFLRRFCSQIARFLQISSFCFSPFLTNLPGSEVKKDLDPFAELKQKYCAVIISQMFPVGALLSLFLHH